MTKEEVAETQAETQVAVQEVEAESEQEATPPGLQPILASLSSIDEEKRSYNCKQLLKCIDLQQQLLELIADPDKFAQDHPDVDVHLKASSLFLENYYHGITGMNHVVSLDMMEPEAVDSGLCIELITPHEQGGCPVYAIPTNPNELCTHIGELLRFCCAGLVAFYCFREFRTRKDPGVTSDEAVLCYTELVIRSCIDKENAAALEAQLQAELPGCSLSINTIRFLMHYARGELLGSLGAVNRLVGNKEAAVRYYYIQQREYLFMVKVEPSSGLGYVKYCSSCMMFQAMQAAHVFIQRGLQHCQQAGDDFHAYQLHFMAAVCTVLGGAGASFIPAAVQEQMAAGQRALDSFLSWAPEFWHEGATSNSQRALVQDKLLPAIAKREGVEELIPEQEYEALKAHYVPQLPQYMPAGVITEGAEEEAAAAQAAAAAAAAQKGEVPAIEGGAAEPAAAEVAA